MSLPMKDRLGVHHRWILSQSLKDKKGGKLVLASHQPDFFPWMGYFYKIFQSDVFVFSDNVQYSKSGRHNYNQILTATGPMKFTLPITRKSFLSTFLRRATRVHDRTGNGVA